MSTSSTSISGSTQQPNPRAPHAASLSPANEETQKFFTQNGRFFIARDEETLPHLFHLGGHPNSSETTSTEKYPHREPSSCGQTPSKNTHFIGTQENALTQTTVTCSLTLSAPQERDDSLIDPQILLNELIRKILISINMESQKINQICNLVLRIYLKEFPNFKAFVEEFKKIIPQDNEIGETGAKKFFQLVQNFIAPQNHETSTSSVSWFRKFNPSFKQVDDKAKMTEILLKIQNQFSPERLELYLRLKAYSKPVKKSLADEIKKAERDDLIFVFQYAKQIGESSLTELITWAMNEKDLNGEVPLINAIQAQDTDRLEFLLELNVDVNAKQSNGNTALICAAQMEQNEKVIELLLTREEIAFYVGDRSSTRTALMWMISNDKSYQTALLLIQKMKFDTSNKYRFDEFTWAVERGRREVVLALLDAPGFEFSLNYLSLIIPKICFCFNNDDTEILNCITKALKKTQFNPILKDYEINRFIANLCQLEDKKFNLSFDHLSAFFIDRLNKVEPVEMQKRCISVAIRAYLSTSKTGNTPFGRQLQQMQQENGPKSEKIADKILQDREAVLKLRANNFTPEFIANQLNLKLDYVKQLIASVEASNSQTTSVFLEPAEPGSEENG